MVAYLVVMAKTVSKDLKCVVPGFLLRVSSRHIVDSRDE